LGTDELLRCNTEVGAVEAWEAKASDKQSRRKGLKSPYVPSRRRISRSLIEGGLMEPLCTGVAIAGAAASLITAGSSAANTAAQLGRTSRERDEYRRKYEETKSDFADSEKKHEDESQKKDTAISVLTIVSVLTFNDLRDAEKRLENKEAEYAETKAALDASKTENAKSQAELNDAKKKLDNFETLLWVGVPTLIILLALAFYFARVKA
jgi:hypothetical protein